MSEPHITTNGETDGCPTHVAEILDLLGPDVVLLEIPSGEKGPRTKNWQQTPASRMQDGRYLRRLGQGNIGVLQGEPSNGVSSIDVDADKDLEEFLELNPKLRETLRTRGARGGNLHVRVKGPYPPLTKLRRRDGREWGEWRATGGQTVVYGKHPDGPDYQIVKRAKPVEMEFSDIVFPHYLVLPWDLTLYNEFVRQYGEPFYAQKRSLKLNQRFHVAKFAAEHVKLFEPSEEQFYNYNEQRGLWVPNSEDLIKMDFGQDLKAYADSQCQPQFITDCTNALLNALVELLRGFAQVDGAFKPKPGVIHVGNGMVHLDVKPPELRGFAPEYYSRNQCPIEIVPERDCPRFKNELLGSALDAPDVSLLQRYFGSVLLGRNAAQRLLLLIGTAGGGKSTLVEILEKLIGLENVTELRTELLGERFEIARFLGKLLLTGKDVPAEFLMRKGASNIKKLVGHDMLSAERKQSNTVFNLRGEFGVVITCNSKLRVTLEGDADAWRRRLLIIEYSKPKPKQRISEFAKRLLQEEGSGILNWALHGAVDHLHELATHGDFVLTSDQQERVEKLLAESDSLREFVRLWIREARGQSITMGDVHDQYAVFCQEMGYKPMAAHVVASQSPELIKEIHGINQRHDVKRGDGIRRGFRGLAIVGGEV
jgi:P4 family phage/plasmid primase-like protien